MRLRHRASARRQWESALAAIDKALAKSPRDVVLHEMKGRVHAVQRSFPQARRALEQALELDPRHFAATVALAQIDMLQKQPDQAIERVRAAAKADPRNTAAALALYRLLAANGASAEVLKDTLAAAIDRRRHAQKPSCSRSILREAAIAADPSASSADPRT